ncbi:MULTISPECIES: aminotransferase class IV [Streptomyces]|uniref:Aminotransferase n=2 Tax=Streptomyces TaxID=1883 RepID=A0A100Y364_9ACTN|nr:MULTISPECIES: aminotransferase class IV [Streptomyces]KUH36780.1 aminotransferase [Streptomyces kanasensis]UUS31255.1 aminotransferase class IV [Streptomyces changanensis]
MTELDGTPAGADQLRALALTNYGHFTTLRVEDGRVRGLALHLERLARDCRAVFGTDLDTDRVRELVRRAVPAPPGGPLVVRVTVYDPELDLGRPAAPATPRVLVTTRPAGPPAPPPLRLRTLTHVRDRAAVKHVALFGVLHTRRAAQLQGADDALFTDRDGHVTEGPTWNVGFVDAADRVVWPEGEALPGVTMALLRRLHAHTTAPVTPAEALGMRAAFVTNAAVGVREVASVDGVPLATGDPVVTALRSAYRDLPGDPL